MELFKQLIRFNDMAGEGGGGAGGGNSIDISQESVNSIAAEIATAVESLTAAKSKADSAVKTAVDAFDAGDSNKALLEQVLTNGTADISSSIATIEEFIDKLKKSTNEWTSAEDEIHAALAAALASSGN